MQQIARFYPEFVAELVLGRAREAERRPRGARDFVVGRAEEQVREAEGPRDGLAALEEGAAVAPEKWRWCFFFGGGGGKKENG